MIYGKESEEDPVDPAGPVVLSFYWLAYIAIGQDDRIFRKDKKFAGSGT